MNGRDQRKQYFRNGNNNNGGERNYYCAVCNVWMANDKVSILTHTNGKKHALKVVEHNQKKRDDTLQQEQMKLTIQKTIQTMESNALQQFRSHDYIHYSHDTNIHSLNTVTTALPSFEPIAAVVPSQPQQSTSSSSALLNAREDNTNKQEWEARKRKRMAENDVKHNDNNHSNYNEINDKNGKFTEDGHYVIEEEVEELNDDNEIDNHNDYDNTGSNDENKAMDCKDSKTTKIKVEDTASEIPEKSPTVDRNSNDDESNETNNASNMFLQENDTANSKISSHKTIRRRRKQPVTYLDGTMYGKCILDIDMPVQLWIGSNLATVQEQRLSYNQYLWIDAIILKLRTITSSSNADATATTESNSNVKTIRTFVADVAYIKQKQQQRQQVTTKSKIVIKKGPKLLSNKLIIKKEIITTTDDEEEEVVKEEKENCKTETSATEIAITATLPVIVTASDDHEYEATAATITKSEAPVYIDNNNTFQLVKDDVKDSNDTNTKNDDIKEDANDFDEEVIEKSVPMNRIRIRLGSKYDSRIPETLEQARILAMGGEEIITIQEQQERSNSNGTTLLTSAGNITTTNNKETKEDGNNDDDELDKLTSWSTIQIRRTTTINQTKDEIKNEREIQRKSRIDEETRVAKLQKEVDVRRMEEERIFGYNDSALGAYDVWNRGTKEGYKGIHIHDDDNAHKSNINNSSSANNADTIYDVMGKKLTMASNVDPTAPTMEKVEFNKNKTKNIKMKKKFRRTTSADDD